MLKGFKQKSALLNNLRMLVKDKELLEKIISKGTTREIKMANFIAIQHGERFLKQFYTEE